MINGQLSVYLEILDLLNILFQLLDDRKIVDLRNKFQFFKGCIFDINIFIYSGIMNVIFK